MANTLLLDLLEFLNHIGKTGITRDDLLEHFDDQYEKKQITTTLYRLSQKKIIYYDLETKMWFLQESMRQLDPDDISRLLYVPFEQSRYFYFFRKNWRKEAADQQKKVYI